MTGAPLVTRWVARATGVIQLILGLIIWTGRADGLILLHILDGLVFVVALLAMTWFAARAGVSRGLVTITVVWALVLPIYGIVQAQLLPGSGHAIIDLVHLFLGLGAIGQGESLARRMARGPLAAARR